MRLTTLLQRFRDRVLFGIKHKKKPNLYCRHASCIKFEITIHLIGFVLRKQQGTNIYESCSRSTRKQGCQVRERRFTFGNLICRVYLSK